MNALTSSPADEAETVPTLVRDLYGAAPTPLRVKLLECLLRPVGPLALSVVASGAFGSLLQRRIWNSGSVTIEDASRISADHLFELAVYLQQAQPEAFVHLSSLLDSSPLALVAGTGALLLTLHLRLRSHLRRNAASG